MEWLKQLILEFLEIYEQESCKWNPKYLQHKIQNAVLDSWFNISKNLLKLKKKNHDLQYSIICRGIRNLFLTIHFIKFKLKKLN